MTGKNDGGLEELLSGNCKFALVHVPFWRVRADWILIDWEIESFSSLLSIHLDDLPYNYTYLGRVAPTIGRVPQPA